MKKYNLSILLVLILSCKIFAQGYSASAHDIEYNCYMTGSIESVLWRIQTGINSKNIDSFDDLFGCSLTIQIDHDVFRNISSIKAAELLKKYLSSKKIIDFMFTVDKENYASGELQYYDDGKKGRTIVSVDLVGNGLNLEIERINFTNDLITY